VFRLFNLVHLKLSYSLDLWRCSRSYHFSIFSALDFSSCTCWPYVLISLFSLQLSHNLVSKNLSLVTCIFLSLWVLIKIFYVDVDISILDIFRYFIVDHFHVFFEDFSSYQPYLILLKFFVFSHRQLPNSKVSHFFFLFILRIQLQFYFFLQDQSSSDSLHFTKLVKLILISLIFNYF